MHHKTIYAVGFLILCISVFVHTIQSANAISTGPNTSLGTNPIDSWSGNFGSDGWFTIATVQNDFIITDIVISGTGDYCSVHVMSAQNAYSTADTVATASFRNGSYRTGNSQFNGNFRSGIKVTGGTTLYAYVSRSGYCLYNISGYYPH